MIKSFNKGIAQNWIPTITGIIIVLLLGGGILTWQYFQQSRVILNPEQIKNIIYIPNIGTVMLVDIAEIDLEKDTISIKLGKHYFSELEPDKKYSCDVSEKTFNQIAKEITNMVNTARRVYNFGIHSPTYSAVITLTNNKKISLSSSGPTFINEKAYSVTTPGFTTLKQEGYNCLETVLQKSAEDEAADWKTYQEKPFQDLQPHKPWKFEFKYPKEFVLKQGDHLDFPSGSFLKAHRSGAGVSSAKVAISVILPQSVYPGTNFQSAWVTIAYDPDIANLPNCQELERNQIVEKMTESQVINGVTWYKGITGSAALGTAIKSKVYHTLHNNMCYEVSLHLATTNIGNFDPALGIKPVDESEVWAKLESIFSTFKFLE